MARSPDRSVSKSRLTPERRRRQLLDKAAELLTERGEAGLQITDLAAAAGVTRPVVYRFFPTRRALVASVLADFESELGLRFVRAAEQRAPTSLEEATRAFIDAVCDTIEAKGAGAWRVFAAGGADVEAARLGRETQERLVTPWLPLVRGVTGASAREVTTLTRMLVAAARAVLELWYDGFLTRAEASSDATRGVTALLRAFTVEDSQQSNRASLAPKTRRHQTGNTRSSRRR